MRVSRIYDTAFTRIKENLYFRVYMDFADSCNSWEHPYVPVTVHIISLSRFKNRRDFRYILIK